MSKIILPRVDKDGVPYISYSQVKLWNEEKGFNTGLPGRQEFMRGYFLGEEFPDKGGFGTFGADVEDYITLRKGAEKFTDAELETLNKIEPLGVLQKEMVIQFDGFYLKGFMDDATPDLVKIRDYKTASNNSRKKYEEDSYWQLDVYALAVKKETGKLPKELEVCIIERLGNGFKGGRGAMTVGQNIWYIPRKTNKERIKSVEENIINTAKEISEYYQVFLKLNA
jgi:hypothetical protein